MTTELIAILDGQETGRVVRNKRARLTFTYDEEWRAAANAYPLSISMPLALAQHGHARIDPFVSGLLPDNQMVLDQWARKFHVSARNAFSLISAVGEDCAGCGAVRPSRTAGSHHGRCRTRNRMARRRQCGAAPARTARRSFRLAHCA
jgi:serine/threonine-protein kinase HipA